jgi:hypothetical protein
MSPRPTCTTFGVKNDVRASIRSLTVRRERNKPPTLQVVGGRESGLTGANNDNIDL